jgi:predicted CXXCH cytochrome family protein
MSPLRTIKSTIFVALLLSFATGSAYTLDSPHNSYAVPPISCTQCHVVHGAPGGALTKTAGNANLCFSCHVSGEQAAAYELLSTEQAVQGVSGVHHRWDATVPSPELIDTAMKNRLDGDTDLMCSTCHDQHSQSKTPFDPTALGVAGAYGRHNQRLDNDANYMCRNCHFDRDVTSVKSYTGSNLSHPVNVSVPSASAKYHDGPREPNGNYQTTSPQYIGNGTGDTNSTNNLILDPNGKVQCMTCHGVHFVDSDANTVDGP